MITGKNMNGNTGITQFSKFAEKARKPAWNCSVVFKPEVE